MKKLVLFHTAASQVAGFERLAEEMGGGRRFLFESIVDGTLLDDLAERGEVDADLAERVATRVGEAAAGGADLVLCTCSSIGEVAEVAGRAAGIAVQRVDRAMAELAVETGSRIVLLATLESTFEASRRLVQSVADEKGKVVEIREVLVEGAWGLLTGGDNDGYMRRIADVLGREARSADVVVLAQASMAGASELVGNLDVAVLSSPELGMRKAVECLRG